MPSVVVSHRISFAVPMNAESRCRVVEYAAWCRRPAGEIAVYDEIDSRLAHQTLAGWLRGHSEAVPLEEPQLRELLRLYGIHLWPRIAVGTEEEAIAAGEELGWDCVLKATAPHLVQRPDMSHVARDVASAAKMREAWTKLHERIDDPSTAGFVVQRMAPPGIPLTVACVEDPLFGPLMSFGVAGMASELLDDRAYRNPPITDLDAAAMVLAWHGGAVALVVLVGWAVGRPALIAAAGGRRR